MALGGVVWLGLRRGQIPLQLFVDPESWGLDLALGLAGGAVLVGAWEAARRLTTAARQLEVEFAGLLGRLSRTEALALACMSGIAEEIFFRGAVQEAWGWLAATALFTLLHTGRGGPLRLWTLFAALAGLLLAGLMLWRGNLLSPMLAHFVVNAVNLGRLRSTGDEPEGAA